MNGTYTTVVGRLATGVERREFTSGASVVSFRVASTERRYDRRTEGWGDGDTLYITVKCWRQLGDNVLASLHVGDPVVAHGRLQCRSFERDGRRESVIELDALAVGPDLRWSTAAVTRTKAAAAVGTQPSEETVMAGPITGGSESDDRWPSDTGQRTTDGVSDTRQPVAAGEAADRR